MLINTDADEDAYHNCPSSTFCLPPLSSSWSTFEINCLCLNAWALLSFPVSNVVFDFPAESLVVSARATVGECARQNEWEASSNEALCLNPIVCVWEEEY